MTLEQNIKILLGEYAFQICVLQQQLTDAQKQITDLQEKKETKQKEETNE